MTDRPDPDSAAADIVGAAGAALVGLLLGGPVGAVAGNALARPVTDLVRRSWAELVAFRQGNVEALLTRAAEQSGIDPEDVITKAQDDSRVSRLFQASLVAAADALDREKIEALATCLANGIRDGARIDEESVMIRALADLDPIHVRVLAWLDTERNGAPADVAVFIRGDSGKSEQLEAPDLSAPVLTVLERNGLVSARSRQIEGREGLRRPPRVYSCTSFGLECLQRLGQRTKQVTNREQLAMLRDLDRAIALGEESLRRDEH
jgi:hypothetical protein